MGATGLEPVTPSVSSRGTRDATVASKQVTPMPSDACTAACTNSPKIDNAIDLDALADVLSSLTPEQRAKLSGLMEQAPNWMR